MAESMHAVMLLLFLTSILIGMGVMCSFFREDKEEQIKPLCPQLVVRELNFAFTFPLSKQEDVFPVTSVLGHTICRVVIDWPDPFRPGASGVAATVRLVSTLDHTLTTLVARNALSGQSLILCRESGEMFASVEPDGPMRYHVRHRTNIHLLTLSGDFGAGNIDGINPAGAKVCGFQAFDGDCRGWVVPHVDAGLAICSLMAVRVHKRLSEPVSMRITAPKELQEVAEVPVQSLPLAPQDEPESTEGRDLNQTVDVEVADANEEDASIPPVPAALAKSEPPEAVLDLEALPHPEAISDSEAVPEEP